MVGSKAVGSRAKFWIASGAGLVIGLLANPARKLAVQAPTLLQKSWDAALKAEHKITIKIIEAIEHTSAQNTARRSLLLMQLKHALGKHAFQEENTVYAMMRKKGLAGEARGLNEEHGEVKQFLFELTELPNSSPEWIEKVVQLRAALEEHMREEETVVFSRLRATLTSDENKHLSTAMNLEGLKLA